MYTVRGWFYVDDRLHFRCFAILNVKKSIEKLPLCWPTISMSKSDEDEERQNVLGESGLQGTLVECKGGALCRWAPFHVCYEKGFLHEGDIIG